MYIYIYVYIYICTYIYVCVHIRYPNHDSRVRTLCEVTMIYPDEFSFLTINHYFLTIINND